VKRALLLLLVARVAAAQSPELTKEFQAGVDAFRLGHYDEARTHLEKARDLDPKLPGPFRFLAAVAKAQGKWQECLDDARRALVLNAASVEAAETRKLHDECRVSAGRAPYRGELADAAAIAVTSNVPGATVKIGGLIMGGTPMAPRPITAGKLEVDVDKHGWKARHLEVDAPAGIVTDVDVELEADTSVGPETGTLAAKATKGTIIVPEEQVFDGPRTCDPSAARSIHSTVDGRSNRYGRFEVEPGTHIIVSDQGCKDEWRRRVHVAAGQELHIEPQFVATAPREHKERIGFAVLAGAGALLATGFGFALASESAANEARDIVRVESSRDPTQPIDTSLEPLRTRADFNAAVDRANRDAVMSDIAYGAGIAAAGVAAYYIYIGAKQRTDVPPPFAVAPTRGGALIGKAIAW
jgi:hypothetical protein